MGHRQCSQNKYKLCEMRSVWCVSVVCTPSTTVLDIAQRTVHSAYYKEQHTKGCLFNFWDKYNSFSWKFCPFFSNFMVSWALFCEHALHRELESFREKNKVR